MAHRERFAVVYREALWDSTESASGRGSERGNGQVTHALAVLRRFTAELEIRSIADVPCGDFNWMPLFLADHPEVAYVGYDVVPELIARNRERHPQRRFEVLDVTRSRPRRADLVFCKDLLNHLSERDVWAALENMVTSGARYLMLTTNRGFDNVDLATDLPHASRLLDLLAPPYDLPSPIHGDHYMLLFRAADVARRLERRGSGARNWRLGMASGSSFPARLLKGLDDLRRAPARLRRLGGRLGVVERRLEATGADLSRLAAASDRLDDLVERLERSVAAQQALTAGATETQARLIGEVQVFRRETRSVLAGLALPEPGLWRDKPDQAAAPADGPVFPHSVVCRQTHFEQPWFAMWTAAMGETLRYHRKLWEFVFIVQALDERGMLGEGRRGLGFGVGQEPLPALFAARGCDVLATDLAGGAAQEAGWVLTAQHAASKQSMQRPDLCPPATFDRRVDFAECDMTRVPDDLTGFDFCWSACALEHLGSIAAGLAFIERSVETLKPGGWAIHTTEFNLGSDDETLDHTSTVLFRKRDILELGARLARKGHRLEPLDLQPRDGPVDRYVDTPPYRSDPHLTLALEGWPTTSVGLIVRRADAGA